MSNRNNLYFLSPHLDDVALSCSGLMFKLKNKFNITIINVFTKGDEGPYTLSGKKFLFDSKKFGNAEKLFINRIEEDKSALSNFNAKIINLDLVDALFRKRHKTHLLCKIIPELCHLYPTYRWHINGRVSEHDDSIFKLKKQLTEIIPQDAIVFAPYNIANHVDHLIVRKISEKIFRNVILYSDFPYNIRKMNYGKPSSVQNTFIFSPDISAKQEIISNYKSQLNGLFPGGIIPNHKEVYFYKKSL